MSTNISDYRKEQTLQTSLRHLDRASQTTRTLQPQGSAALSVGWFTLYDFFPVPDSTIVPYYTHYWFEAHDTSQMVIATISRSVFLQYTNGTFINADLEEHGIGDDDWEVWMTYDKRSPVENTEVAYSPSGTFFARLNTHLSAFSLPTHKVQFGVKVNRMNSTAKPSNASQFLIIIQARIVMGGST